MTNEIWKPIVGYEGSYEVSNLGRVKSLTRVTDRGRKWRGRMMTPYPMRNGYLIVTLWRNGRQRTQLVHRLVLAAFVGPPKGGQEGLHRDGNQTNNTLVNLAWGSHSENQLDQVAHGNHTHASKTHCPRNHPFDETNTYWYPGKPHRGCRTCRRDYAREYARKMRTLRSPESESA